MPGTCKAAVTSLVLPIMCAESVVPGIPEISCESLYPPQTRYTVRFE